MVERDEGKSTVVKAEHSSNALVPMVIKFGERVKSIKDELPLNELSPTEVTPLPKSTFAIAASFENA